MMSNFICQIFNESGDRLRINLSQSHPAWMDMLNLLCGAKPLEWIDDSSHNKLFICSSELKVRIHEICSKYKSQESNLSVIEDYFNNQVDNSRLAFLREGALLSVDNNLVKKAVFMVRKANFFVTYNVISFGDKEEYTGPNDLNACVCRFCGKKYPEVRFKKKNAHAIPDALGNKLVFCIDECQSCIAALSPIDKELAEYLNNAGFKVTQATVSRDIRDLKLTKLSVNGGRQKYIVHRQEDDGMNEKYIRVLCDGFVSMDMAQNILVIKTVSGMAMAVAAALDAIKFHEVVGCIAGDDTIMCAVRSVDDTIIVMEKIKKMVED